MSSLKTPANGKLSEFLDEVGKEILRRMEIQGLKEMLKSHMRNAQLCWQQSYFTHGQQAEPILPTGSPACGRSLP